MSKYLNDPSLKRDRMRVDNVTRENPGLRVKKIDLPYVMLDDNRTVYRYNLDTDIVHPRYVYPVENCYDDPDHVDNTDGYYDFFCVKMTQIDFEIAQMVSGKDFVAFLTTDGKVYLHGERVCDMFNLCSENERYTQESPLRLCDKIPEKVVAMNVCRAQYYTGASRLCVLTSSGQTLFSRYDHADAKSENCRFHRRLREGVKLYKSIGFEKVMEARSSSCVFIVMVDRQTHRFFYALGVCPCYDYLPDPDPSVAYEIWNGFGACGDKEVYARETRFGPYLVLFRFDGTRYSVDVNNDFTNIHEGFSAELGSVFVSKLVYTPMFTL